MRVPAYGERYGDGGGLDAVSVRHVAAELGCGTMSLYDYVPRKEDLHELMVDAVSGEHVRWESSGYAGHEPATTERTRSLPWSAEEALRRVPAGFG